MNGYLQAFRQYAVFRGRADRAAYWWFALFHLLVILAISFLERQFAIANPEIYFGKITGLYLLLSFLPVQALSVRRLHDLGRSGWWVLLKLIPLLGWLLVQVLALLPGHATANRYGQAPSHSSER